MIPAARTPARPLFLVSILGAAALARIVAARGDLWLDEIWSLRMSQQVRSALEIFTGLHHDNNHPLNTLYLRFLGPVAPFFAYRLLSLLTGIGSVWLAHRIGARRSVLEGRVAAVLFALSFPMIVYGSEARGYAPAVFFGLVSYEAVDRYLAPRARRALVPTVVFGASCMLGLVSHPTFLYAYAAAACCSLARLFGRETTMGARLRGLAALHALPLAFFVLYYLVDLRHLGRGGGNPGSWTGSFVRSFSLVLGGPEFGWGAKVCGFLAILGAIAAIAIAARTALHRSVCFAVAVFLAPGTLRLAVRTDVVYVRYFLVSLAFFLLLIAGPIAELLRRAGAARVTAIACGALFVLGNAVHCARFFQHERGSYLEATRFLIDSTEGQTVTVGSDHDFRNRVVLEFAAERLGGEKPIEMYTVGTWKNPGPEWFLAHRQDPAPMPLPERAGPSGEVYRMVRVFPYGGLSGWDWVVYRRD